VKVLRPKIRCAVEGMGQGADFVQDMRRLRMKAQCILPIKCDTEKKYSAIGEATKKAAESQEARGSELQLHGPDHGRK